MGNKKKMVKIYGDFIKKRLIVINSTQKDLADYLGITPRHLNRQIQSNEMAEDMAVKVCNYLDVNIALVIKNPNSYTMNNALLDGMSFSEQYQLSLKQPDSMKKLFYLLMRYCGCSEREIYTYTDEAIGHYLKRIEMFIEDEIIEPHFLYIKEKYPKLFDWMQLTSEDTAFDNEYNQKQSDLKKKEKAEMNHQRKIINVDTGKLLALYNAGFSNKDIASEFNLDVKDIETIMKNLKEGDADDLT